MKVLMSAGKKTGNIMTAIGPKFRASGDEFLRVDYLDDIDGIFARGEYFDKAIISEQSITREYEITDEVELRQRVNDFAAIMAKRGNRFQFVFLTQDADLAELIYDEILDIQSISVVVFSKPPYQVKFFTNLVVEDIKKLDNDIVFKPKSIESEIPVDTGDEFDIPDEVLESDDIVVGQTPDKFDDLFNNNINADNNSDVSDELDIDTGLNTNGAVDGTNFSFEGFGDSSDTDDEDDNSFSLDGADFDSAFDSLDEDGENTDSFGSNSSFDSDGFDSAGSFDSDGFDSAGFGDNNSDDVEEGIPIDPESMDMITGSDVVRQSSELPNFNVEASGYQDASMNFDEQLDSFGVETNSVNNEASEDNQSNSSEESFNYGQNFINSNETYHGDDSSNCEYEDSNYGDEQDTSGFENVEYENSDEYSENSDDTDDAFGFDNSMYGNDADKGFNEDAYSNENEQTGEDNFESDMYDENTCFSADDYTNQEVQIEPEPINTDGFDPNYYSQEETTDQTQQLEAQNINAGMQTQPQEKKKGLFGFKAKGFMRKKENKGNNKNNNSTSLFKTGKLTASQVKENLQPFAARGNSIVVTGCGGCGTSVIAYNLANIISQLGYTVLLVDMDTIGKTQSYISKTNYESMEVEDAKLLAAVNSTSDIGNNLAIVKQGFHLATMGLATDSVPIDNIIKKERIPRFINSCKSTHNFIIYDVPFLQAVDYLADVVYTADNLVLVSDASTWGLTKMMLHVTNVDSEDMQDTIFSKTQLVFNKYRNLSSLLGVPVKTGVDITKTLDKKMIELMGEDPGVHFSDLRISGIINDDPDFEKAWFEDVQYSDTAKGQQVFLELINNIVLGK